MAVVLRLQRGGRKKKAFYRIVAADSRAPRDGKFLEIVGTYNPCVEDNNVEIKEQKFEEWLKKGAKMTSTVKNIYKSWKKKTND